MREIKFRAWEASSKTMLHGVSTGTIQIWSNTTGYGAKTKDCILMQFTGLLDKNGKEIYEGDIVGEEGVYHFLDRKGWEPDSGEWKIIGEKTENFTGEGDEKYIAGYKLKVVEWKEKSCGFEPFSDSEDNCFHCGGGVNPNQYEVLGNLYEHPELLK